MKMICGYSNKGAKNNTMINDVANAHNEKQVSGKIDEYIWLVSARLSFHLRIQMYMSHQNNKDLHKNVINDWRYEWNKWVGESVWM